LKTDVNVPTVRKKGEKVEKKLIFAGILKATEERAGSGSGSRIHNPVYGSEYPDPYQNVTDPEHWWLHCRM
jgi:hypothetical protein